MNITRIDNPSQKGKRVVLAGAGNIGSSAIPHLARLPGVTDVTIIDRDVYEAGNLSQQDIVPGDVGRPKAAVQARRLRLINPALRVRAVQADLQDVPLGLFQADVILGGLDSLDARRLVNQAAWRCGVPWIDAGIRAQGGLYARVTVYVPGKDSACLECAWDATHYGAIRQKHPCQNGPVRSAPTNAPLSLGAMVAAYQAIECRKLLQGDLAHSLAGRQALLDVQNHACCVSGFRRNPQCRFDHGTWKIHNIGRGPGAITFGQVLDSSASAGKGEWVRVEGRPFVRKLQCPSCGRTRGAMGLLGRLSPSQSKCPDCGEPMDHVGFDMVERLDLASAGASLLARPLSRLGFRQGDVLSIGRRDGGEDHYSIGGDTV